MRFDGMTAFVTGASGGIGLATARRLIDAGARVALASRNADSLEREVDRMGGDALGVVCDVADEASVAAAFERVEAHFGIVSLLVNNAGFVEPAVIESLSLDDWNRTLTVNLTGTFLTCRRAVPPMKQAGRGAIVNVASISGVPGPEKFPGFTAYCAAKAGVISLTEALAVELAGSGIRINAVSPGSVDTAMWARVSGNAPAQMTADEVADAILFLLSGRSRPMNGRNLHVWS